MSLFIGNLPPHIRREELEHEFGRFGKSYIKLKDGYGFAVYEDPEDAERALRALRGKDICGEQTTLTWSNRQPKSFQKFPRTNRFYEPHIGRNIRRGNNILRNRDTYGRRDFMRRAATNHGEPSLLNPNNREQDDVVEKTGVLTDEKVKRSDDGVLAVSSPADENDRWGEPVPNTLEGVEPGDDTMFERYEPKYDFDSIGVEEKQRETHFSPSPTHIKSLDKDAREHSTDAHVNHTEKSKPKPVCFNCGLLGHIIRNCPSGTGTRPEKFNKFRSGKDGSIASRFRVEKQPLLKARSWRTSTTREMPSMRHQPSSARHSQSGKRKMLMEREDFTENNEHYRTKQRMVTQGRKRNKHCVRSPSTLPQRRRGSVSAYSHESTSRLSLSGHSYYSRSRSSISLSCSSRSTYSASSEGRTKIHRSKSGSSSSLSKSLPSSSDMKAPSVNNDVNAAISLIQYDKGDHASSPRYGNISSAELDLRGSNAELNAANSSPSHQDHVSSPRCGNISSTELDIPASNAEMEVEVVDSSLIAGYKVQKKDPHNGYKAPQFSTENMKIEMVALDENCIDSKKLKESIIEKADHEVAVIGSDTENCKSTRMSLQEVHVAFKHYGLKVPELCEPEPSTESFFGAARLWPWQIIYYRRLKKGPISTENYARRVAQNKEFGIIDKYVRSSSGWGEC